MSVHKELKKIELLCEYANKLVNDAGLEDQSIRSELYGVNNNEYFKSLLYVSNVFPSFRDNDGVSFDVRRLLYKRISSLGKRAHYITLLDPMEGDSYKSDFWYYESKKDMDECESLSDLKIKVRSMIKNPSMHFRSE